MNAIKMNKILRVSLIGASMFAFVLLAQPASASSSNTPKLYSITQKTSTWVVLPIKDTKFKNQTTTAVISIRKEATKMVSERMIKVSLDSRGDGSIKIGGLQSKTKYTFKVRLMKMGENKTTGNSDSKSAKTL